jgi:hypothetical protein
MTGNEAGTIVGSCHCGRVRIEAPHPPLWVASCNCSLCRKTGWLVAYYRPDLVRIEGETIPYVWGDRLIGIHHCPVCGCGTHWLALEEALAGDLSDDLRSALENRMGVNARLLDGFDPDRVEVRKHDNAG